MSSSSDLSRNTPRAAVLFLTPFLNIGGLEKMIVDLSISLHEQGSWDPVVLAYDMKEQQGIETLLPPLRQKGVKVELHHKGPRFSLGAVRKIVDTVRKHSVRVIHSHDLGALIYATLAKIALLGTVKIVHTQHSFFDLDTKPRYRIYQRIFSLFADELVVVSPDTKKTYVELGVSPKHIHLIPNGVPFQEPPVLTRKERLERRLHLLNDLDKDPHFAALKGWQNDLWLLYLARVHPVKGQRKVLELWQSLPLEIRERARLLIVGPDSAQGELEKIRELAHRSTGSEHILVPGGTTRTRAFISSADLFISSSEYEGLPLTPLEAIGQGIPVLLSDIPGHEFLKDVSVQYPLSEPAQGAEKAAQILRQDESPDRENQLRTASEWVRAHYSHKAMINAYTSLYDDATGIA